MSSLFVYIIIVSIYQYIIEMCECKTAKEIMDEIRPSDDGCKNKVKRFNRVLRQFYLDTINVSYNYEVQSLNADGHVKTEFPIYRTIAFVWGWCSDNNCIMDFKDICCWDWIKIYKMEEIHGWEIWSGMYIQDCEDEIRFMLPSWATNAQLVYAKGPIELEMMTEKVCMHSAMLVWLQHLLESFYYESEWEVNRMTLANTKYTEWLKKINESTFKPIFKVGTGWVNNKHLKWYNK